MYEAGSTKYNSGQEMNGLRHAESGHSSKLIWNGITAAIGTAGGDGKKDKRGGSYSIAYT